MHNFFNTQNLVWGHDILLEACPPDPLGNTIDEKRCRRSSHSSVCAQPWKTIMILEQVMWYMICFFLLIDKPFNMCNIHIKYKQYCDVWFQQETATCKLLLLQQGSFTFGYCAIFTPTQQMVLYLYTVCHRTSTSLSISKKFLC